MLEFIISTVVLLKYVLKLALPNRLLISKTRPKAIVPQLPVISQVGVFHVTVKENGKIRPRKRTQGDFLCLAFQVSLFITRLQVCVKITEKLTSGCGAVLQVNQSLSASVSLYNKYILFLEVLGTELGTNMISSYSMIELYPQLFSQFVSLTLTKLPRPALNFLVVQAAGISSVLTSVAEIIYLYHLTRDCTIFF